MFFLNVEQGKWECNGWEEQEKGGAFGRKGKKRRGEIKREMEEKGPGR